MEQNAIISIIRGVEPENILDITKTLLDNGVSWLEVSLSDEEKGLKCIQEISKAFKGKIHLGVGTVITNQQVDKAIEAGASYIITPGWDRELVRYILSRDIPVYPGVYSPGEVMQASSLGIKIVKLFPVINHDLSYVKNIKGPFPNIEFMAVGGVNKNNIRDLKQAGFSYFAIGSNLVPKDATKKDLNSIAASAKEYINILKEEG